MKEIKRNKKYFWIKIFKCVLNRSLYLALSLWQDHIPLFSPPSLYQMPLVIFCISFRSISASVWHLFTHYNGYHFLFNHLSLSCICLCLSLPLLVTPLFVDVITDQKIDTCTQANSVWCALGSSWLCVRVLRTYKSSVCSPGCLNRYVCVCVCVSSLQLCTHAWLPLEFVCCCCPLLFRTKTN